MAAQTLADRIFALCPAARYVAVRRGDDLHQQERAGLSDASSPESDRYEELLVNPTLLTLTQRRGAIDCGGLDFVLVGYGNFRQLVIPLADGHVSVALEKHAVSIEGLGRISKAVVEMTAR